MLDLAGQTFGHLTVLRRADRGAWFCRCTCGKEKAVLGGNLRKGHTRSCGCRMNIKKHGLSRSREHRIWRAMRSRCRNPNHTAYADYGGRGILVCARWNSFELFLADMGPCPTVEHSIDRIDVDGSYEPGNCRWATSSTQASNKRSTGPLVRKLQAELAEAKAEIARLRVLVG